jgi:hypothetical protein
MTSPSLSSDGRKIPYKEVRVLSESDQYDK